MNVRAPLASPVNPAASPNWGEGAPAGLAPMFPVASGTAAEHAAFKRLLERARGAGLRGARLQGVVADPRPHAPELAHALVGFAATLVAPIVGAAGVLGLAVVVVAAGSRCLGGQGLGALWPRFPSWNLVLCGAGPRARKVTVAALDRARRVEALPWVVLAALVIAVLSLLAGGVAWLLAMVILLGIAAFAAVVGRSPVAAADAPEAALVEAMFAAAGNAGPEEEVLLSGSGALAGKGCAAWCDWWGLDRRALEVVVVEGPEGLATPALVRAGWRARRAT